MNSTIAQGVVAWLLTYTLHSTALLGAAWLVIRWRRADPAAVNLLWKVALIGGVVTSSAQTAFNLRPTGTIALSSAVPVQTTAPALSQADDKTFTTDRSNRSPRAAPIPTPGPQTDNSLLVSDAPSTPLAPSVLIAWAWLVVAGGLILWYAARTLILVGRLGDRRVLMAGELHGVLRTLMERAGIERSILLTSSTTISSPVALGRSEICLPAAALTELEPAQLQAMLAHELAHLVRRDPIWLTFSCLFERAFFFQPLNRLARRGMQQSAEYLADEWAAQQTGGVPLARCLVKVAEWTQASPLGVPVAGMAEERSQLAARVTRLLDARGFGPRRSQRALTLASFIALGGMAWFAPGVVGRAAAAAAQTDMPSNDGRPSTGNAPVTAAAPPVSDSWKTAAPIIPNVPVDGDVDVPGLEDCCKGLDPAIQRDIANAMKQVGRISVSGPKFAGAIASAASAAAMAGMEGFRRMNRGDIDAKGDTAVVRALMARLKDEDAEVRQAAARSLGRIREPMAIPALVSALEDGNRDVRLESLDALSNFEKGVPVVPIRKLLASADTEIRDAALDIIVNLKDRESIPVLGKLVHDPDSEVRQRAIQALEEIGDPSIGPVIISALEDRDADVRKTALSALHNLKTPLSDDVLLRALKDPVIDVRHEALDIAADRRMASMVPEIIRMMDDKDADIRECAAESLAGINTDVARAALKNALTHSDPRVRRVAVEYFGDRDNQ